MKRFLSILILSILLFSCTKTDEDPIPSGQNSDTVFVLNEGAFGAGNAEVSLYFPNSKKIRNNVFFSTNGRILGDVLQSAVRNNDRIYFVLNNSGKIEIANSSSMLQLGAITGLKLPRYIKFISNNLAWVSCWGDGGCILKVDVSTKQIIDSVKTGSGPEEIIYISNRVFVANSGGFVDDSTITVVNSLTGNLEQTITVGDNPISMVVDANGKIWVLCKGKVIYDANWNIIGHSSSKLVMLNPNNLQIEKTITLFTNQHPSRLQINPALTLLYIGSGYGFQGIYKHGINDQTFVSSPIISASYYGFNVSPKNGTLYCSKAPNFSSNGKLEVFAPSGELLDIQTAGIGPNSIIF